MILKTIKNVKDWINNLYDSYGIEFYYEKDFKEYKKNSKSVFSEVQIEMMNKEKEIAISICKKNDIDINDISIEIYKNKILKNESKLKTFKQFILNETKQKVSYSGFKLNSISHKLCIDIFKFLDCEDKDEWILKCHHVTLNMGELKEYCIDEKCKDFEFDIIGIGISDKAICLAVEIKSKFPFKFVSSFQHITLAHNPKNGGKPFHSNQCQVNPLNNELKEYINNQTLIGTLTEFDNAGNSI